MISIILNSRKRIELLKNLLSSISRTVSDLSNIEVLINLDSDDTESIDLINSIRSSLQFNCRALIADRIDNMMKRINISASEAVGDYIFILNDDVQFETYYWDLKIDFDPNKVLYIGTNDNSIDKEGGKQYSSFPILTRAAYNALGRFMCEEFVGLGADVHLWRIFNEIGRITHCDIDLDHILHRTVDAVLSPDQTAAEMRKNSWSTPVNCWTLDISKDVERLKNEIESRML